MRVHLFLALKISKSQKQFFESSFINVSKFYQVLPEYIYNSHYGNGDVYFLVLSSWKVNIAENPIAVMGL